MKFGTQINLVYTEYDGAIYFKFEDTCHLLIPIWSRFSLRQIKFSIFFVASNKIRAKFRKYVAAQN